MLVHARCSVAPSSSMGEVQSRGGSLAECSSLPLEASDRPLAAAPGATSVSKLNVHNTYHASYARFFHP
jgi:hypothetical protein